MPTKHKFDFDIAKLKKVPIEQIRPNDYNPKEEDTKEYKKVVRSLKRNGLRAPIAVREIDTDLYEIIDGEQRYTAAKEIGYTEIYVYNEGKMSDEEAKAMTIWYEVSVPFETLSLANLVVELDSMDMELPYSETEIAEFKNIAEMGVDPSNDDQQKDKGDGRHLNIKLTPEQYEIVIRAIEFIKEDNQCGDARALELLAADYLSGI